MAARSAASFVKVVKPLVVKEDCSFLSKVAEIQGRLRLESEKRGYALLASLLDITRDQAEDDLRAHTEVLRVSSVVGNTRKHLLDEDDDGVVRMAAKLAWRSKQDPSLKRRAKAR